MPAEARPTGASWSPPADIASPWSRSPIGRRDSVGGSGLGDSCSPGGTVARRVAGNDCLPGSAEPGNRPVLRCVTNDPERAGASSPSLPRLWVRSRAQVGIAENPVATTETTWQFARRLIEVAATADGVRSAVLSTAGSGTRTAEHRSPAGETRFGDLAGGESGTDGSLTAIRPRGGALMLTGSVPTDEIAGAESVLLGDLGCVWLRWRWQPRPPRSRRLVAEG